MAMGQSLRIAAPLAAAAFLASWGLATAAIGGHSRARCD